MNDDLTGRSELDYLESLVKHPGWLIVLEKARREWGAEGYGRRIKVTVAQTPANELPAAIQAVDLAQTELNALLSWPEQRIKALKEAQVPHEVSYSRRGPL